VRQAGPARARIRDLGVVPGTLPPGPGNAVTDVPGVRVGHATVIEAARGGHGTAEHGATEHGEIRSGVTAIVHDALLGRDPDGRRALPAGLAVFNGFGKMTGATQLDELGSIETPVLLTSTLSVFRVADALLTYLHGLPAFAGPPSLNPVVAETNDGHLSDIWARRITAGHVAAALDNAAAGLVAEGCVGAGTGTRALGFKAGIGTSSRRVPAAARGPVTVGALVQANFGGLLTVCGRPVPPPAPQPSHAGNSCVIVLATDAALDAAALRRLASRAFAGMTRTGSDFSGRSGDYSLAVSIASAGEPAVPAEDLDLLFTAAIEATEEAILNSLCMAVTTTGYQGHVSEAVPLELISGTRDSRYGS